MERAPAVGHGPLAARMTICGPRAGAAALARAGALERPEDMAASAVYLAYDLTVAAGHGVPFFCHRAAHLKAFMG
jgi:hypothetical protein